MVLNDDVPSQWPYTALSQIRDRALMSVIGVVSSVGKEPTRTSTGGTDCISKPSGRRSQYMFLQIGALVSPC